jgi:hypothetical protein
VLLDPEKGTRGPCAFFERDDVGSGWGPWRCVGRERAAGILEQLPAGVVICPQCGGNCDDGDADSDGCGPRHCPACQWREGEDV